MTDDENESPALTDARRLLNRVREGEPIPAKEVENALRITGDLAPYEFPMCRLPVVQIRTPAGNWNQRLPGAALPASWLAPIFMNKEHQ